MKVNLSNLSRLILLILLLPDPLISTTTDDERAVTIIENILDQIVSWKKGHHHPRPFVTLTFAQSLDGKIALSGDKEGQETSSNFQISCKESQRMTHALRSAHDAIMIGGRTLSIDNPRLSNRSWGTRQPTPIVLDTNLKHLKILGNKIRAKNLIVCCTADAALRCQSIPEGVTLLPSELNDDGFLDLFLILEALQEKLGIESIMVEGGSKVLESFAKNNLVDCFCVTTSPQILGERGLSALSNICPSDGKFSLNSPNFFNLGTDCILLSKWLVSSE